MTEMSSLDDMPGNHVVSPPGRRITRRPFFNDTAISVDRRSPEIAMVEFK